MESSSSRAAWILALLLGFGSWFAGSAPATAQSNKPKHGADFAKALRARMDVTWTDRPLRQALDRISKKHDIAIVLDRRVDPQQLVTVTIPLTELDKLLAILARRVQSRTSLVGSVIVVGPPASSGNLATLLAIRRDQLKTAGDAARRRFLSSAAFSWPELATPAELLKRLETEAGIRIDGIDQIPHDLWPAQVLPPSPWINRLAIILAGFDKTFEFTSNNSVKIVPFPKNVAFTRRYSVRVSDGALGRLRKAFADAKFVRVSDTILEVTGNLETHESIQSLAGGNAGRRPIAQRPAEIVLDLKVDNAQVGTILRSLERQRKLRIRVSAAARDKLTEKVSLDVKQVTVEELLRRTLDPVGLRFSIDGTTVNIDLK